MSQEKDSIFWKMQEGTLPPPASAVLLGARFLDIRPELGEIEMEFEGKATFTNPVGNIQGGILAAMLDETIGPALGAMLDKGEFSPTINLNTQFLNPAKVGKIYSFGKVEKKGKKVCFVRAELQQDDKIIATATASLLIVKI